MVQENICIDDYESSNPQPNIQEKYIPGIVFYLHTSETGGQYLINSMELQPDYRVIKDFYHKEVGGRSLESIKSDMDMYLNNNYYDRLVFYDHHNSVPFNETLPLILECKEEAESKGFIFDIVITFREPIGRTISRYNYNYINPNGRKDIPDDIMKDFSNFIVSELNGQLTYYYQNDTTFYPWKVENVEYEDFHPYVFMNGIFSDLEKIDFIFHTDNLDDLILYFKLRFDLDWIEGDRNESIKYVTTKMLNMTTIEKIVEQQSLDQLLVTQARKLGTAKFVNFVATAITVPY